MFGQYLCPYVVPLVTFEKQMTTNAWTKNNICAIRYK